MARRSPSQTRSRSSSASSRVCSAPRTQPRASPSSCRSGRRSGKADERPGHHEMTAVISPIALVLLAGGAMAATGRRWWQLLGLMRRSTRRESRVDHIGKRIGAFFVYVVAQGRLLRWPFAGILHALIFWGFIVLLTAIAQAIVEALWLGFQFQQLPGSWVLALLQDLFFLLVECGIVMALVNRLFVNPTRFRGSHRGDALLILAWIGGLLLFMELN